MELKGNLYYFFNKSSGGEIGKFDLASTFDHDWGSTVPTGACLAKAPHPVEVKEDIMVFGNGRYLGVYFTDDNKLSPTKLDFGNNNEVADVVFIIIIGWWQSMSGYLVQTEIKGRFIFMMGRLYLLYSRMKQRSVSRG